MEKQKKQKEEEEHKSLVQKKTNSTQKILFADEPKKNRTNSTNSTLVEHNLI